jgi:membrane protease YdiL (CAAX protease family)
VLGFCLGLIMIFHRSIWPAVMAHGFFDATTFAILPWVKDLLETTQKTLGH